MKLEACMLIYIDNVQHHPESVGQSLKEMVQVLGADTTKCKVEKGLLRRV